MIPERPVPPSSRPVRDWTDTAIEWASGATAVGMFAYGVALSYSVLHHIARAAALPPWAARLWPLGFEAFMASAALNALADQRQRQDRREWWQRVPWYPWALTVLTAGGSILLNWFHPAIPLDPPPGWLVSLVYGLPPLAAVFAWHLFLQRLAHRRHQDSEQPQQDSDDLEQDTPRRERAAGERGSAGEQDSQDPSPGDGRTDPRAAIRALLAAETPQSRVTATDVQAKTGLSRSRAYAVLRQVRAETTSTNGQHPPAPVVPIGGEVESSEPPGA